jgi:hypothetical protein
MNSAREPRPKGSKGGAPGTTFVSQGGNEKGGSALGNTATLPEVPGGGFTLIIAAVPTRTAALDRVRLPSRTR